MKLGNLTLEGKTFLAPLAGFTNLPFRRLVKECGCAVVCSEMVSAKGMAYASEKTFTLLDTLPEEQPLSLQIFGAEPESMGQAAAIIDQRADTAIIDINFGCSVRKVVKQGAGVSLMREPELSRKVIRAVRKNTSLPFTIKIRAGWDVSGEQAFNIARIAQDEGVDAIALHPRTAVQAFRGHSDWSLIARLKEKLEIPVIGNGDINTPEDAKKMMDETGCDAVMVGRAVMGNPFLLGQIDSYLETGEYEIPNTWSVFRTMEKLVRLYVEYFTEETACKMLRGRLSWFVKGLPGCSEFRKNLSHLTSQDHAIEMIRAYGRHIGAEPPQSPKN